MPSISIFVKPVLRLLNMGMSSGHVDVIKGGPVQRRDCLSFLDWTLLFIHGLIETYMLDLLIGD